MRIQALIAILLISSVPAFSMVITTFQSEALWEAGTSSFQVINFENTPTFSGFSGPYLSTYSSNGVTIAPPTGNMEYVNTAVSPYWNYGTGIALMITIGTNLSTFHVTLPAAITAVSANVMTGSPSTSGFQVSVAGNTYNIATQVEPTPGFFGATFDTPITSIDFTSLGPVGSYAFLDNIHFGVAATQQQAPQTPEVATLLTIGSGLLAIGFFRKRLVRFVAA